MYGVLRYDKIIISCLAAREISMCSLNLIIIGWESYLLG